jgi:hypothetical protein
MTEQQAIDALISAGIHARIREWSLGRSIFAGVGEFNHRDIHGYAHARYIYLKDEVWHVLDCNVNDHVCANLEQAVSHTINSLSSLVNAGA